MSRDNDFINIRVSQQILWIGSAAYPLRNVARARSERLVPRRGAALGRYLRSVVLWFFLGFIATIAIKAAGFHSLSVTVADVTAVMLILIAISTVRLLVRLLRRTYYALVIETAGAPSTTVVSDDQNLVDQLVFRITDAINKPDIEFTQKVENLHFGDKILQFGDHNLGKVVQ